MKKDEFIERYGIEAYQRQLEQNRKWQKENPEYRKEYYQENKENIKEYNRKYYQDNQDNFKEYKKEYNKTPMGRADTLVQAYKTADKNANRGKCTITAKWIIEHIFNSQCVYCGESDWQKLGCDRIDNNLPHTPDNVVCACWDCNRERKTMKFEEFLEYKMKKG